MKECLNRSCTPYLGLFLLAVCFVAGCAEHDGPALAPVSGRVTLDGEPLGGAFLEFQPETGRGSGAYTDEQGSYSIQYSADRPGAVIGDHRVTISTYQEGNEEEDGAITGGVPEKIPVNYNRRSELSRTVEAGGNTFDFEIKSDEGPVLQPDEEDDGARGNQP